MKSNQYYHQDIVDFCRQNIPGNAKILDIGCRFEKHSGHIKEDIVALDMYKAEGGLSTVNDKYDIIIISDALASVYDLQKFFRLLKDKSSQETRIIITFHNFLWEPLLKLAEFLRFKHSQNKLNWLNKEDIVNLLELEGYEIVKSGNRFLFPLYLPLVSKFINRYIAALPLVNRLCLTRYLIVRNTGPEAYQTISCRQSAWWFRPATKKAISKMP